MQRLDHLTVQHIQHLPGGFLIGGEIVENPAVQSSNDRKDLAASNRYRQHLVGGPQIPFLNADDFIVVVTPDKLTADIDPAGAQIADSLIRITIDFLQQIGDPARLSLIGFRGRPTPMTAKSRVLHFSRTDCIYRLPIYRFLS